MGIKSLLRLAYDYMVVKRSGLFDASWYLSEYNDVKENNANPILHYLRHGAPENRNPSAQFDTLAYIQNYPDVKQANINALVHYIKYGQKEGRETSAGIGKIAPDKIIFSEHILALGTQSVAKNSFKSVAIVAELGIAQCTKYRVNQMRDIFESFGYMVELSSWRDLPRSMSVLQRVSTVIFYRVPMNTEIYSYYFYEAKRLKLRIGYDIDDPVFDPIVVANNDNITHLKKQTKYNLISDSAKFLTALFSSDFCIVSTEGMKERLRELGYNKRVLIRKNGIDTESLRYASSAHTKEPSDSVKIIYATPSKAHQSDFLMIEESLVSILKRYKGAVKLVLMGDLKLSKRLEEVKEHIESIELKPYGAFLQDLSQMDINLVPLLDSAFNKTKSNIKFLDAALVGVPSICANVGDYRSLASGNYCYLFDTNEELEHQLVSLIEDRDLREAMGSKAKAFVHENYNLEQCADELKAFVGEIA